MTLLARDADALGSIKVEVEVEEDLLDFFCFISFLYLNLYLFDMYFVKCLVMPRRGKNSSSMRLITTRKALVCESP